jgi:hypothetical protein
VTVATLEHANAPFVARSIAAKLPKKLEAADLGWVGWAPPYDALPPNPQLEALIPNFQPTFSSDNFLVLLRAAEAGLGAIVLGDLRHRFKAPTPLVPLALDLGAFRRSSLHLVCARSALEIFRVRLVAELLAAEVERISA